MNRINVMRDTYLDSSKAILIFLVVFGHYLERLNGWENPINHAFLSMIYLIHMPAFIFVSGMLFNDQKWLKNILFFIALYIPFQILLPSFASGMLHLQWNLFERPYWILWYLLGMMAWTVLTHFLIKTQFAVMIAFVFSLLIGFSPWSNYQYSIGRIFVFLPFFVIGNVYGNSIIQYIQKYKYALQSSVLIFIVLASVVSYININPFWLYGSLSYSQLKVSLLDGIWIRIGCLLLSSIGIFAFLALTKLSNQHFLQLGRNTLAVYLLHGFVVIFIAQHLNLHLNIALEMMICALFSILTCWILQQNYLTHALKVLSQWLLVPVEKVFNKF